MIIKKHTNGFTLIELMIIMAIIAILGAVAYPNYMESVRGTYRKDAMGEVLQMAAGIERIKAQRFSYASANGMSRIINRYEIVVAVQDPTEFTITATPNGDQVNDLCETLVYDQNNNWTFQSGGSDLGLTPEECIN